MQHNSINYNIFGRIPSQLTIKMKIIYLSPSFPYRFPLLFLSLTWDTSAALLVIVLKIHNLNKTINF